MEYVAGKDKLLFVIQEHTLKTRIIIVPQREFMLHRKEEYDLIREKCRVKWLEYDGGKLVPAKVMYKKVFLSKDNKECIIDEDSPVSDAYNLLLYYFSLSPNKILLPSFSSNSNVNLYTISELSSPNFSESSISSSTDNLLELSNFSNLNESKIKNEYLDDKDIFWVNKCKFFLASNNDHLTNYMTYKKMENVTEAYLFLEM